MTELHIVTRALDVLFTATVAEEHASLELQSITFVADIYGSTRVTAVYWDDFQSFMQRVATPQVPAATNTDALESHNDGVARNAGGPKPSRPEASLG